MARFTSRVVSIVAGAGLLGSVALAATPIKNGFYVDKTHRVVIILAGTHVVTPTVTCRGTRYVPPRGLFLKPGGRFAYSGTADKEGGRAHPPSPTKLTLSVRGTFQTNHLVTGKAKVAGCAVRYRAKYAGSHS